MGTCSHWLGAPYQWHSFCCCPTRLLYEIVTSSPDVCGLRLLISHSCPTPVTVHGHRAMASGRSISPAHGHSLQLETSEGFLLTCRGDQACDVSHAPSTTQARLQKTGSTKTTSLHSCLPLPIFPHSCFLSGENEFINDVTEVPWDCFLKPPTAAVWGQNPHSLHSRQAWG